MNVRPRKRLLIGLLIGGLLVIACATAALAYLVSRPGMLARLFGLATWCATFVALPILATGILSLVVSIAWGRNIPILSGMIRATITTLMPIAEWLGRVVGFRPDAIQRSFIEINNRLVCGARCAVDPSRLLVLLPHCMQSVDCARRVDGDATNCVRCGGCRIGEALKLRDRLGFAICVASGGGQAREAVKRLRPHAIIAVACERELVSGLRDVSGIPVLGILNLRPNGPCLNTDADLAAVSRAVTDFLSGEVVADAVR